MALAGAILAGVGKAQEASFYQALNVQNGKVTGTLTDHAAAVSQANAIGSRETTGVILTVAGVVAAGLGVYLVLSAPSTRVAIVPDGQGVRVGWRF